MQNNRELIRAISLIADDQNVRVTLSQSCKGAVICGVSTFIGGLLMGSKGLALGGAIGGAAAYALSDDFQSLGSVLLNLSQAQKMELARLVRDALDSFGTKDLAALAFLILRNKPLGQKALQTAISFVTRELNAVVIN